MSDDIIQGTDGTLIAEFRLAERMHRQNVISNTYETVTCAASNGVSFHQCADVAGAATIAEDEASKWSIEADDVYYGTLAGYLDSSNAQPFGVACGSERVGDGVVNTFDIAVFAFAMFNRAPYNVPLTTQTVVMRSELAQECSNKTTRGDWQAKLSTSFCPVGAGRRRRLAESDLSDVSDHVDLWEHSRIEGGVRGSGTWYQISIDGIQSVVEIMMDGIWVDYPVGLVNEPYPRKDDPHTHLPDNFNKVELRWARKMEFLDMQTSSCSPIVNGVSGTIALEGDTIGIRQEGTSAQLLCAFVVFIYVPDTVLTAQPLPVDQPYRSATIPVGFRRQLSLDGNSHIPTVQVLAGSTWRYPKKGYILELDATAVRSDDYFVSAANATSAPPPPPRFENISIPFMIWVLIILCIVFAAILLLLFCYWGCFITFLSRRRTREEEEEEERERKRRINNATNVGKPFRMEHVPLLDIKVGI
jgi:hypothetical protein